MKQETLFVLDTPYRQKLHVEGFRFGRGEKSLCVVGAMRGNEVQQMYICSQLVRQLKWMEHHGDISSGYEILVVPCVNHFSINVGSRFWAMDGTDINRMFPGYDAGETTQRIASALFEAVKDYPYGVHFASSHMPGEPVPHVRMLDTGYQNANLANLFGLPYVMLRKPTPYDTTTLDYNWQVWETNSFSIYTKSTAAIDEASAQEAVTAVLRFLSRLGIVKYNCHSGYISTLVHEESLTNVMTPCGGIFRRLADPGQFVEYHQVLGQLLDPFTGEVRAELLSPTNGTVFFAVDYALVTEHTTAFRIIRRLHS